MEIAKVILYPSLAEKSVAMIDKNNKMVFFVDTRATRKDVKEAIEVMFKVKVDKVNILKDAKNRKKAFVKINKQFKAEDIATAMGIV
ncbi:MAG: 50S ribosomal protein L23 [Candidatus Diapherotrites archaeon]|nr:50S ribosomal protein L23 [Candidatus Diapherotrites archaeon]